MDTTSDTISCAQHGAAYTTYICEHLAANPVQRWHCDYPSEDDQWPDAWCSMCHSEYLKEGEWNDNNEDALLIKLACHHCYEEARAQSVDYLGGDDLEAWKSLVAKCCNELHEKQDVLASEFSLNKHKRWDWNQAEGELIFSNDDVPAVVAKIQFVGSISTKSDTWLWSWANFHLLDTVKDRIKEVRELGEIKGFPRLTIPKWVAEEVDGWEMAAISAHVLNARGVYRTPEESGFTFMVITDIWRP